MNEILLGLKKRFEQSDHAHTIHHIDGSENEMTIWFKDGTTLKLKAEYIEDKEDQNGSVMVNGEIDSAERSGWKISPFSIVLNLFWGSIVVYALYVLLNMK